MRWVWFVALAGLVVAVSFWRLSHPKSNTSPAAGSQPASAEVVVYASMDQPTAAGLFQQIEKKTGIHIVPQYDAEASKTTGLVNKIRGERSVPQADLFWDNEPYQMEQLGREGLLEPYDSPAARDLPSGVIPAHHRWTPMTLKPRVVAFQPGTTRHLISVRPATMPSSGLEYWMAVGLSKADRGRWAISNPQFGTSRGHFGVLAAGAGMELYQQWLTALADNGVRVVDGNSVAAEQVGRKEVDFSWTDLDDALAVRANGLPVGLYLPPGRPVLTPATVALIARGPHPEAAKKVFDALVSPEAEEWMARSEMRLVPIRPALRDRLLAEQPALWPQEVQRVDWSAFPDVPKVVDVMPQAMQAAKDKLLHQ